MALERPAWWESRGPAAWPWLLPAALFRLLTVLRRRLHGLGWLPVRKLPVPVVVVGNIAAGGSGKTPVVIWLAQTLRQRGYSPGILSRGYGGASTVPTAVGEASDPELVGDEPLLLARRTGCPLWVGRDRFAAGQALLRANPGVDLLITDDGLQHYRLGRNVELVVINERILGNLWPMPAGPLREPLARLADADLLILNGALGECLRRALPAHVPAWPMQLESAGFYRLGAAHERCGVADFAGRRLHALAGIADPERFFATLRAMGLTLASCRALGDHHAFQPGDLDVPDGEVLLLTEKDAVKCAPLAPADCWVLPVDARIDEAALGPILERLHGSQAA